ncbi:MAG: efflux RND transporter periplasmic adaptor subunit [Myxococcales bacterium]
MRVVRAARRTLAETLPVAGPLLPPPGADVKLGALVAGRLAELPVAEGDRVRAGQLLARIEATPFRDALAQAQAQLAQARAQAKNDGRKLERAEKLAAAGIAAKQEVGDARAQAAASAAAEEVAAAALSTAKNQLGRTELRAPFEGQVAHVFAAAGEPTDGSGKPIVEVARTETLELHAAAPASEASRLVPGLRAAVKVAGSSRVWAGEVVAVAPLLSADTGTATVRIRLDNPEHLLKGGEMAQAEILLATRAGALAVPDSALVPAQQSGGNAEAAAAEAGPEALAVETVDATDHAQRRPVKLGLRGQGWAEILEGLHEGETVIVQGAYALPDGALVKPEEDGSGPRTAAEGRSIQP